MAKQSMDTLAKRSNLTKAQLMIWLGQALQRDVPLYNMSLTIKIDREICHKTFVDAFSSVVTRSDAMRSTFVVEDGVPQRRISGNDSNSCQFHDRTGQTPESKEFLDWIEAENSKMFSLHERAYKSVLIRFGRSDYIWYIKKHHLIIDGWSIANLLHEVSSAYCTFEAGDEIGTALLPEYEKFASWEKQNRNSPKAQKAIQYWMDLASGPIRPVSFYQKLPAKVSTHSHRISIDLGTDRSSKIRQLAQNPEIRSLTRGLSLFCFFSTTLFALLHRLSEETQLTIGAPVGNRPTKTFKDTIGLCVELFPFPVEVKVGESFRSLLKKVKSQSHQLLVNALPGTSGSRSHNSFNVILNYIDMKLEFLDGTSTTQWLHSGHMDPNHHLRLEIHDFDDTGNFTLLFDVNTDIFTDEMQAWLVDHFLMVLDSQVENLDQQIANVELCGPSDFAMTNPLQNHQPKSDDNLVNRFQLQAKATPDAPAVNFESETITYAQLDRQSDIIAAHLSSGNLVAMGDLVGLVSTRSQHLITKILAILKLGAAFVPIDPGYPKSRIELLINDANIDTILTVDALPAMQSVNNVQVVSIKPILADKNTIEFPPQKIAPTDLAYIIYTSGSTGTPNGVMIEHRSVVHLVASLSERIYQNHEGILNVAVLAPLVFDPSVQQIFASLLLGHCLHIAPEHARMDGDELTAFYSRHKIDVTDGTPAHLRLLAATDHRGNSNLPKQFIIGGDRLETSDVESFLKSANPQNPVVTNIYGVAECCVDSTSFDYVPGSEVSSSGAVSIGKPLSHCEVLVVNSENQIQPVGVKGQIAIAGAGLARGYLNNEVLTRSKFVDHPDIEGERLYLTGDIGRYSVDGNVEFLGRMDHQIKIHGVRIEPGEIENQLLKFSFEANKTTFTTSPNPTVVETPRCSKCLLTTKHPGIALDQNNVCNQCKEFEKYESAASTYFQTPSGFDALIKQAGQENPSSDYDCMLLFSGGKDSSYVLHRLVEHGLKVLAFTFDNGFISKAAFNNIQRQCEILDVDSIVETTPRMNDIFIESLLADSTVCSGCFRALTAISTRIAQDKGINLVVTGLSRGQIFDTKLSGLLREGITNVEEIEEKLQYFRQVFHSNDDRTSKLLNVDLNDVKIEDIHFADYFRYDLTGVTGVRDYLKQKDSFWNDPTDTGFCSSNCLMNDVGICMHSQTRGFHNYEAPLSWDIRLGVSAREEVMHEVTANVRTKPVASILDRIGYFQKKISQARVLGNKLSDGTNSLTAYYVANQVIGSDEIRGFLGNKIPGYMIPAAFLQVERLPITAHGKIDDDALRKINLKMDTIANFVAPVTAMEKNLVAIWQKVLGVQKIGTKDNFFDLGGDSIGAIQIVAKANKAGIRIEAPQLLSAQTVADLSQVAQFHRDSSITVFPSGPLMLTPIQRSYFEGHKQEPPIIAQTIVVAADIKIQHDSLATAVMQVVNRHETLRTRFTFKDDEWHADILPEQSVPNDIPQVKVPIGGTQKEFEAHIDEKINELASGLSVTNGNLFEAALLSAQTGSTLVLVAHHIAVDALSWPIILDELMTACRQALSGERVQLAANANSFAHWTNAIASHEIAAEFQNEKEYWQSQLSIPEHSSAQPGYASYAGRAGEAAEHISTFDSKQIGLLTGQIPKQGWQPPSLILAALACSLGQNFAVNDISIDMEGHGRESIVDAPDTSQMVGWFTTIFPTLVNTQHLNHRQITEEHYLDFITAVDQQVRAIPQNGFNFAFLKQSGAVECKNGVNFGGVLLNYLGSAEGLVPAGSGLRLARELQLWRAADYQRSHALEVNVMIIGGKLQASWTYDMSMFEQSKIHALADGFRTHLGHIIQVSAHSRRKQTLTDKFPLANLNEKNLGKLSSLLNPSSQVAD